MPIILDNNVVQNLNGPTHAIFLQQTMQREGLNDNYLIFFWRYTFNG